MSIIYRKTAKGISEIETRAHRLSPRLRSALIMVDGKKTDADLQPLLAGHADETLATLIGQGFIETVTVIDIRLPPLPGQPLPSPPSSPLSTPAPAAAAGGAPPISSLGAGPTGPQFTTLQREVVRQLNDQIGPLAETLAIRIERCKTAAELRPLLDLAWKLVENVRGTPAAAAFRARFITW